MKILGRKPSVLSRAITNGAHYRAMLRSFRVYEKPVEGLTRYIFGTGQYPWRPILRTPTGIIQPTLYGRQDILTVNEIFCRQDYGDGRGRVFVDIGANIGLSALYFLTRDDESVVYAFEPVPRNLSRLEENLRPYRARIQIDPRAVSTKNGTAEFITEESGRLGGLAAFSTRTGSTVTVDCVSIADALDSVVDREGKIDVLKIDTEGSEISLVESIPRRLHKSIAAVVWENNDGTTRWKRYDD